MPSDRIEINLSVPRKDLEDLTHHQRIQLLGTMAVDEADAAVPLPPDRAPWRGRYTEAEIRKAFRDWARLHGGIAPSKREWSREFDPGPDHIWPRSDRVTEVSHDIARAYGISTSWTAPHRKDPAQRDLWHADEPGYCVECFQGDGCRPPEMSPWQFAVEFLGGLQVRTGGDHHATKSQIDGYGRNRQMVTGGVADVYPMSSDPAAGVVIESIDARKR